MRRALLFASLLLSCTALAVARAAEPLPPPVRPLTLLELSDLALRNNPQTRAAWAEVRRSEAAERIARAAQWPTLAASFTGTRSQQIANEGNPISAQTRYGPSVSLSYLLLDFGGREGAIDQAAAQALSAQLLRDQTLQDLLLAVETAYYARIGSVAVETARRQSLDEARANAEAARTRHDAGVATIADVYQGEAALAAAQLTLQQAEGARLIADGDLAVAAGYPPDTVLSLAEWAPAQNPVLPTMSSQELLQQARDARPELLAAKASEQAAEAAIRNARSRNWPTLTLSGNAGQTEVTGRGKSKQYSVSARADLPLFSGFSVQAAIAQAQAARELAQADSEVMRRAVEQQVWTAYQNVQTAHRNLDAARAQLRAAGQAADALRARYQSGLSTMLEVLSTESALAEARVADVQAGINWHLALATLGHDAGGLQPPPAGADNAKE